MHPNCVSLPFIRNHNFARYGTKGCVFKAFRAFPSHLQGRLKTETVNLSLKNAILCLKLTGLFHFDILFVGCFSSCRGQPSIFHKKQIMQFTAQPNISKMLDNNQYNFDAFLIYLWNKRNKAKIGSVDMTMEVINTA